jgi:hypothetical protein
VAPDILCSGGISRVHLTGGVFMSKNHIVRLPEYYQQENKDLLYVDEINQITALRLLVIDDE